MSTPASASTINIDHTSNPLTMTRFLLSQKRNFRDSTGTFSMLLQSVQLACKIISNSVRRAGIDNLMGVITNSNTNSTGDVQKKLDILANDVFINCLTFSDQVYIMGSEENEQPIIVDSHSGGYAVVFDPLDGSSNIDCNLSVGTIFGIYKKSPSSDEPTSVKDLLKPGTELVAAGYALYDAATMIVLSTGLGVNGFTLDPVIGEFMLTHPDMKIPKSGKYYSINEGNSLNYDEATKEWVSWNKKQKKALRYVGSMVGDVHRTLLYGGTFAYPGDSKNKDGKLRLIYECNPMAMIIEQAGGKATTGKQRILDIKPTKLHQKCPIFVGSWSEITRLEECYARQANAEAGKPIKANM